MRCEFSLNLKPPFSYELSMGVWLRHPDEQIDLIKDGEYSRLFRVDGHPALLSIKNTGTTENPSCKVTIEGPDAQSYSEWAKETVKAILNEEADVEAFYGHLAKTDTQLFNGIASLRGLKPVQVPTLFETLVFAIVGQQVNVTFAYHCRIALENKYSWKTKVNGVERVCALTPEDLLDATVDELRELKISRNKSKSIIKLAKAFVSGDMLEVKELKKLPEQEIDKKLLSQFGIGPWTVEYAKIRALGFADSLPSGDAGLRAAMERFYQTDRKPSPEEIEQVGEKWKPFRSWATYYLWTWLGLEEKNKKK